MNRWTKICVAFLAVAAWSLTSQRAFAQQAEDPSRPAFLGRVDCGDGRQCDAYRLGQDTRIEYLWYSAQLAVERVLGRRILTDRRWWDYRLSDMLFPLDPHMRRGAMQPALINAAGSGEFVSLELLVQLNNGTNGSSNPFNAPAMCNGRREHPLRYGVSSLNRRVHEEVTLVNVERLLPSGCRSRGISTVDGTRVLIPTSGGSTIGQRIDALTRDGLALVENGTSNIARLRQDRQQVREWESRRNVTIEPERRRAFDAYVDRVLEALDRSETNATDPHPIVLDPATAQTPDVLVKKPQNPEDKTLRVLVEIREELPIAEWIALFILVFVVFIFSTLYWRARGRVGDRELTIAQLCTRRDELLRQVGKKDEVLAAPLAVPQTLHPDLRPELAKQRESYELSLKLANESKAKVVEERDQLTRRVEDLKEQISKMRSSLSGLLGEIFHQLKALYNDELVEGRRLQEPASLISMVFTQMKMPMPDAFSVGVIADDVESNRRPTRQAFASMGDALAKSRSNGNGNGGKKRRRTESGIPPVAQIASQSGNTLPPPEPADSAALPGEATHLTDVSQIRKSAAAPEEAALPVHASEPPKGT